MSNQSTGGVTFESFDFNWNNFQMGEWNRAQLKVLE